MAHNTAILEAVERLQYRVTVGDVAAEAGLPLREAEQGILALASDVKAHLQVSEEGEIAYAFPRNMQAILLSQSWRLRLQQLWQRIWRVLFYLIRISFGILLIVSLLLIVVAISILVIAMSSARENDDRGGGFGGGGGMIFFPRVWFGPDIFWLFDFDYGRRRRPTPRQSGSEMNFLEAIFSFLFGDGNPNADLEERRWQTVANVIRNNDGVVVAEQVAPYLDDLGQGWSKDFEDYMLPVLSRFNGNPEVSPEGGIVYRFPELQVMAADRRRISVPSFLKEFPWRFSQAGSGQVLTAIGLGCANWVGALVLGSLLQDQVLVAQLGGLVAFANSIYWLLLGYGTAFLGIPLVRYFWVQWRNRKVTARNDRREDRAQILASPDPDLRNKLAFAQQFAAQTIVGTDDLAYTTEKDLVEQEAENRDKIDEEWRRRLEELR